MNGATSAAPTVADVVEARRRARLPVAVLPGPAAVVPEGGRILALAADEGAPSLLWRDPESALGGDRLWFAPEWAYYWWGEPDWRTLATHRVPRDVDPGRWRMTRRGDVVVLRTSVHLRPSDGGPSVHARVRREIRPSTVPFASDDIRAAGLEVRHRVRPQGRIRPGRFALWHIAQVPPGATLIVPLRPALDPITSYALPGSWVRRPDHLRWDFSGRERAKLGVAAEAVTGRVGVVAASSFGASLLVRDFAPPTGEPHVDHPVGRPRTDQVVFAWDGLGFGEMEHQGPEIRGVHTESHRLWAVEGSVGAVERAARSLLGVDGVRPG